MCYLIAKDIDRSGCVALKSAHGKALSDLQKRLLSKIGFEKIQLVTISRPSAYGEYEPYKFAHDEAEFEKTVEKMAKIQSSL